MPKNIVIVDEIIEYPITGDSNYGEEATQFACSTAEVLADVSGPGDIPTTEVTLIGTPSGSYTEGNITNMLFDTAFVQSILVTGHLTREFTDATPTKVEYFSIEGAYNGTEIVFSVDYSGDDTEVEFSATGGQFEFSYLTVDPDGPTDTVKIKYSAKAKIDETFFP